MIKLDWSAVALSIILSLSHENHAIFQEIYQFWTNPFSEKKFWKKRDFRDNLLQLFLQHVIYNFESKQELIFVFSEKIKISTCE